MAVVLPERVRDALARAPLPRGGGGAIVKPVSVPNLHLTLKFLGEVPEALLPPLSEALAEASSRVEPFEIEVAGMGVFPPRGAPRVVWAGVRDRGPRGIGLERLRVLAARVDAAAAAAAVPLDDRPFHPHVTLARVRGRLRGAALPPDPAERATSFGTVRVEAVTLFESELRPEGAHHAVRRTFACGGGVAGGGGVP